MSRTADILADAAHLVFEQPSKSFSGNFLIDDTFLHDTGKITDFETAKGKEEPGFDSQHKGIRWELYKQAASFRCSRLTSADRAPENYQREGYSTGRFGWQ